MDQAVACMQYHVRTDALPQLRAVRGEEAVEEGLEHRHVAHLGRDVRHLFGCFGVGVCGSVYNWRLDMYKGQGTDHDGVVVRSREGEPLEAERDVAAVLQPEEPHGEGREEPGGRDVRPACLD